MPDVVNLAAGAAGVVAAAPPKFRVVARQDAGPIRSTQSSVPETEWCRTSWWREGIRYVRLSANGRTAVYETTLRPSAQGNEIWLADRQLGLAHNDASDVVIETSSKFRFDLQALVQTGYGRLLILGLAIGLTGVAIDASLEAGKRGFVLVETSPLGLLVAAISSMLLKAVGLLATFLTASFFKKD